MAKQQSCQKFCGVADFQAVIPYSDLVNLLEIANNFSTLLERMDALEKQHDRLRVMYFEALDKIAEIRHLI